ncbi:hypothetical protein [Bacteroides heparinolyticus]|uniref:hypothetical protein n=1 Tax=Prevotella heparinolytica TaxID=28113 RepID=UPI00359FEA26
MTYKKHILILWCLLFVGNTTVFANHRAYFGNGWSAAERYVDEHHTEWKRVFDEFGVNARLAEAVVFPELLRYSMWQDEIETAAVNVFYVTGGKEKADFSIGRFQMKPSFAEDVEREWNNSPLAKEYGFIFNLLDNAEARRSRIHRLATIKGQCRYLAIFLCLQQLRNPWLSKKSDTIQLRYLATAYNYSHTAPSKDILSRQNRCTFHTDVIKIHSTRFFCYADIATEFFVSKH